MKGFSGSPLIRNRNKRSVSTQLHEVGVLLVGCLSVPPTSRPAASKYAREYTIAFPLLFDSSGELAHRLAPSPTPEALGLNRATNIKYRRRIDHLFIDLRKH